MDSAKENKRLGIKTPRSILCPPYLLVNQYFVDYADAMDEIFGPTIDEKIEAIAQIRNMWVQNTNTEDSVRNGELISTTQWTQPEREILVKQVNMLGMRLRNAGVVNDQAYLTIARFVGEYWFGKGTQEFADFIGFCLGNDLRVVNLWTSDYVDFYREGSPSIGTPIWDGGTWYPTTHVELIAKNGLAGLDIVTLQAFFYEIANYNLVLQAISSEFDMYMVDRIEEGHKLATIVSAGLWADNNMVVANFKGFGASPPSSHFIGVLNTGYQLPTTYLAPDGAPADFNTAYLLAKPSGWAQTDDGKKFPVYGVGYMTPHEGVNIGVELIGGDPLPGDQFNLLYGPVVWMPVPGSRISRARIPTYGTGTFTVNEAETSVSALTVGTQRTGLLVNPAGFFEVSPGRFAPYWL